MRYEYCQVFKVYSNRAKARDLKLLSIISVFFLGRFSKNDTMKIVLERRVTLRRKRPYSELLWSAFSSIRTKYGEILWISPYSVRMPENTDQNNSEYGHLLAVLRYQLKTRLLFLFSFSTKTMMLLIKVFAIKHGKKIRKLK